MYSEINQLNLINFITIYDFFLVYYDGFTFL